MSSPVFHQYPPADWMHPHNSPQFFNPHATSSNHMGQMYNAAPSDNPYYEQANPFQPQYNQHYENPGAAYGAHPVIQSTHSPQPDLRPHRRQNSNSTNGSYASLRSSYPQQNQLPYSSTFDNAYVDQPYEAYPGSNNANYQKHLPTPIHTPIQDLSMDGQRGYDRRSGPPNAGQKLPRQVYNDEGAHTPRHMHVDHGAEDYNGLQQHNARRVPAFDRTYSAIVQDELFDPNAVRQPPPPASHNSSGKNPPIYRSIVTDRLQAANDARVARSPVGRVSREASPFRQGSPFAGHGPSYAPIGSAAAQRQQQKAEADALMFQRHHPPPNDTQPNTISPKEALLDYNEPQDDGPALFQQASGVSDTSNYDSGNRGYNALTGRQQVPSQYQAPLPPFGFTAPSVPASAQASASSQDYKFPPQHYRTEASDDSQEHPDYPAHLVSMDTSKSEQEGESQSHDSDVERPAGTTADGGTYTCTYQGCSQRFTSAALLQKHKREGHRASVSAASQQAPSSPGGSTPPRNSQAGPHRCDRINPSTGKPCNTIFSRPYDLTRHEDTIHAQRTKVRCQYCTEEKTFSRSDALTRHMRVVHPNIDFPGKHRRRPTEP